MAVRPLNPMSAGTRRSFVRYIAAKQLGLTGDEVGLLDMSKRADPVGIAWRAWALARRPQLIKELEALNDAELLHRYECEVTPAGQPLPEWMSFLPAEMDRQGHTQLVILPVEDAEREYSRRLGRKGGRTHGSRSQPDLVVAIQDMYRRNPRIKPEAAHHELTRGYAMPDGRVVTFNPPITIGTFKRHYWKHRKRQ